MNWISSFLVLFFITSSIKPQSNSNKPLDKQLDMYLKTIAERYEIPGMALAVVRDGSVIHEKYYGKADLDSDTPVEANTLFKLHSLSKVFVATGVFQLVEKDKLDLDDFIGEYIEDLPAAWQKVQIKHLLTHSSGLPDMVRYEATNEIEHKAKVFKGAIEFKPGARFSYNQTNFWLLNRMIAKISKKSFENFVLDHQFEGRKNALIFAQNTQARNRATEYFADGKGIMKEKKFDVPEYMYGAAGIALTLREFIDWNLRLDNNELLKPETKKRMWSPFQYKNDHQFAYGWGVNSVNGHSVIGFSGGTIVSLKKFVEDDLTIILLTTGYKYFSGVNSSVMHIAGLIDDTLLDRDVAIRFELMNHILQKTFDQVKQEYERLKATYPEANFEGIINSLGYELVGRNRIRDAIKYFMMNAEEYPDSWNVWDSLAEGYEMSGDTTNALINYQRSVELNPDNRHGLEKLKSLGKK
ncbi:serine hydrolase [Flavobacteriaceae bacterium TP-CH-4]|uniref:Serine hydrolase n=1 Tax=Pelagihabitans pacificus TaxID=2696054 RepID=A0A967AQC0_9FLAO|nr:serine hydrolase [Pelagihabitans pacificus]NHF58409.1 serine hydrolase [Pelagihabitans pacificus]